MKKFICVAALLVCVGVFAGCSSAKKEQAPQDRTGEAGKSNETGTAAPAEDGGTSGNEESGEYIIVSNGVRFTIPDDYAVSIEDESGNIYIDDKDLDFNLVMIVRDGSYEESLKDKDELTAKAREQDVDIVKDVTEYTSDGKSYAYFTFSYKDENGDYTVIYTGATKDKRIGMNMTINAGDLTEEDVIDRINVFLKTAEATDLADTTQEDLYSQEGLNDTSMQAEGESIDETELKLGNTTIKVKIPDDYLYQSDEDVLEEDMFAKQYFQSEDLSDVTLSLYAEGLYDDLKELVDSECIVNDNAKGAKTEGPKEKSIDGKKVVYKLTSYSYGGTTFNKVAAAYELPDKSVYVVYIQNLDGDELSLDDVGDFMTFETK